MCFNLSLGSASGVWSCRAFLFYRLSFSGAERTDELSLWQGWFRFLTGFTQQDFHFTLDTFLPCLIPIPRLVTDHTLRDHFGVLRPVVEPFIKRIILPDPVSTVLHKAIQVSVNATFQLVDIRDALVLHERRCPLTTDTACTVQKYLFPLQFVSVLHHPIWKFCRSAHTRI